MKRVNMGFTLIEVMIAAVIVVILASVAYPSYIAFLAKAARSEAQTELVRIANLQEQYFNDHRTYTTNLSNLVGGAAATFTTENGFYTIAAAAVTDIKVDYKLTATAAGVQATRDSKCATLTLTNLGEKSGASSDCWG